MTKTEFNNLCQKQENEEIESMVEFFNEYFRSSSYGTAKRLRNCTAKVYTSDRFYVLQSYNTIVAFIDRETDTLYDVLRFVYGYTSTSAKHIRKFEKDYCGSTCGCKNRLVWRNAS